MKKAQLLLTIITLIPLAGFSLPAQGPMGGPPPGGPPPDAFGSSAEIPSVNSQTRKLTKLLNLTDEQKGKVRSIFEEQKKQYEKLDRDETISEGELTWSVEELQKTTSARIREVLSEDQKARFDEYDDKKQKSKEQQPGGEMPPPPPF
jgi:Spy/CpxP family protein refolding chaperone